MERNKLEQIFKSKFNADNWKKVVSSLFDNIDIYKTPIEYIDKTVKFHELAQSIKEFGSAQLADKKIIKFYDVELDEDKHVTKNRVGLRNLIHREVIPGDVDAIFAIYHTKGDKDWRLTFISKSVFWDNDFNENREETQPKRFTYVLGEDESIKTALTQFVSLFNQELKIKDLIKAFSVEKLNNEFFDKYKEQYKDFTKNIAQVEDIEDSSKKDRDFVKKMLGRIVFLYFLQKKEWLGASSDEYADGDRNFIKNYWEQSGKGKDFYSKYLAKLFFDGLNSSDRKGDKFILPNGKEVKVPFLNGGLFEKERNEPKSTSFKPELFESLFEFLGEYNFTIDENSFDDFEVGIDPEMLGHIFENLLEENRKKTGAFYTPKEVVAFMTQESLKQYLLTAFLKNDIDLTEQEEISLNDLIKYKFQGSESAEVEESLSKERLLEYLRQSKFIQKHGTSINKYLDDVRICDPAIGSGAFPMGLLNEIYHCKIAINSSLTSDEKADVKRHIIENSIYGVDIEKGAVDIAQLRFWLSLIVEEDKPHALPNLDYKIVVGNSLFTRFENERMHIDWDIKSAGTGKKLASDIRKDLKTLTEKQKEFFESSEKARLHYDIRNLKIGIIENQILFNQKKYNANHAIQGNIFEKKKNKRGKKDKLAVQNFGDLLNKIEVLKKDKNKELEFFDWKVNFPEVLNEEVVGDNTGFDIVIGNPPYLRVQGIRDESPKYADDIVAAYESATGSFDLYAVFTEKALELTKQDGILNFIMPVKWTNAAFGKGLRKVIQKENAAHKIISFGAHQVFNASTYTGLQWFKRSSNRLQYIELNRGLNSESDLNHYLNGLNNSDYANISNEKLLEQPWVLVDAQTQFVINLIEEHPRALDSVFTKIFQGIATSKDDVYFLYDCVKYDGYVEGYSKAADRLIRIESDFVKPILKGEDVHKYTKIIENKFTIFPYVFNEDGIAKLIIENKIKSHFPLGYKYLKEFENVLREREKGRFDIDGEWFQYGRKQGLNAANIEKLIGPDISLGGNYAYDKNGNFFSTTTNYGYIKTEETKEGYKYLMAISE